MPTYHIITIGCQMNKSDSERVASHLESMNFTFTGNKFRADLVVVVTCGVRQAAEHRVYGLVPRIKKENPKAKIILTGCLSHRNDVKRILNENIDEIIPIEKIFNFQFSILKLKGNSRKLIKKIRPLNCEYLNFEPKYNSKFTAFVPIGNGCNNFCSYCVVPYARGREKYRPAGAILAEVKKLVARGFKEVILIAQNVNSYKGRMTNVEVRMSNKNDKYGRTVNFAELLRIINGIKGDFWIRFATSHPKDMSTELINTITECEKVCRHIHLPVQAGDDKVLRIMNRQYTVKQYNNLVNKIRTRMDTEKNTDRHGENIWQPPVAISTDIIVGFPSETRGQFNNSKNLFKKIKFDMAYIAQYSSRPETAAGKLKDDVSKEQKKKREEELNIILRKTALENNKIYIDKTLKILAENKNKKGELFGKTETNKNVKIMNSQPQKDDLVGKFIYVKINKAFDFGLAGKIKYA